jgi:hypothetical protein
LARQAKWHNVTLRCVSTIIFVVERNKYIHALVSTGSVFAVNCGPKKMGKLKK